MVHQMYATKSGRSHTQPKKIVIQTHLKLVQNKKGCYPNALEIG